jgi:hypothetical protein
VLELGVIAPVDALILNPDVDAKVPPVVPVIVTACAVARLVQKGPAYAIVAAGRAVMVTEAVAVIVAHPVDVGVV